MLGKIIREVRRGIYKLPVFQHANAHEIHVRSGESLDIAKLLYWGERKPFLRIHLPINMISMEGALQYSATCNPFVATLANGPAWLEAHYEAFQPANLQEMYRLEKRGLVGENLAVNILPWILAREGRTDSGELGLGPEHGVSYFGPVTKQKLALELKRLETTRESIVSKGYLPDRHGDITGYFFRNGDDFRFKIRGGKHRAAVLTHMGNDTMPVRMKPGWPRVIDRAYAKEWPLVQSGAVDQQLALDIFDRFFDAQPLDEIHRQK